MIVSYKDLYCFQVEVYNHNFINNIIEMLLQEIITKDIEIISMYIHHIDIERVF